GTTFSDEARYWLPIYGSPTELDVDRYVIIQRVLEILAGGSNGTFVFAPRGGIQTRYRRIETVIYDKSHGRTSIIKSQGGPSISSKTMSETHGPGNAMLSKGRWQRQCVAPSVVIIS